MPPTDADQRFPRESRVRRRFEFRRAQERGKRVHTPHYVVLVAPRADLVGRDGAPLLAPLPTGAHGARLGLTVSRKVGNAVARNRVKRVLREVFRRNRALFPEAVDLVVIAKDGAPALGYDACLDELRKASDALRTAARRVLTAPVTKERRP